MSSTIGAPRVSRGARRREKRPEDTVRPRLGHVNLRVADLERATRFYRYALGFELTAWGPDFGIPIAFLASEDYHHPLALNTFESAGAEPPPTGHTGLHHVALRYDGPCDLADATRRLLDHGHPLEAAIDHGATVSVYLSDTEGNGLELYYDRPPNRRYGAGGRPVLRNDPIELNRILDATAG